MESWRYANSEAKSPLLWDEMGLPADAVGKLSMGRNTCNLNRILGSNREEIVSMMGNSDPVDPRFNLLGCEIGTCFSSASPSPSSMITSNLPFGESESGLSLSSPAIVSNGEKSSPTGWKLGELAELEEAKNSRFLNEGPNSSLFGTPLTATKRARTGNWLSQIPVCQVHGCNKDLSASKDYYKRHRVCDVHSKTARVIVNGIEQRFCQQCSRFHLLSEFDDGKRSCRRRLAGHNERRRKSQLDILSGARFLQNSLPKRLSFVLPEMLGLFGPQENTQGKQSCHPKAEEGPFHSPRLEMPTTGKQTSSDHFLSQTVYTFPETSSRIEELSGIANSTSALSLLSAQSRNLASPFTGTAGAHSRVDQNSEKNSGFINFPSNGFCSSRLNSVEAHQVDPSVSYGAIDFEFQTESGIVQRSHSVASKSHIFPEISPTVDLIQLSAHLRRVEQQRTSVQLKQENDAFCSFST
ncbi:squamosa promoter-binding-like protein 6 [Diospyros lotus]|uniref:squamosa promoter-binding-like protein 6 n=1 Tax=Diospyros lotus TaxID=55363 RepID=UPI0022591E69|nr:squamosa promoter-binding-like protein 6 [Diospyros lotus]XP_052184295.1 squamosa promoter-binding-like protein 6 [Diospyros lotus]